MAAMRSLGFLCLLIAASPAFSASTFPPPSIDTSQLVTQTQLPAAVVTNAPVQSVNGRTGAIVTATLPGAFSVQDGGSNPLPDPTSVAGRYANAMDVGGAGPNGGLGYGQLYSTGVCWKRTSPYASPLQIAAATTIAIKSLAQSPVLQLTGSAYNAAATINVTNACPGDVFTVMVPNGVFGLLGTLGLSINGSSVLSGLGPASWADYAWTGTTLVKIRGGNL